METFFTLKVSLVLRRQINHGQQNQDHIRIKSPFHETGHPISIDGRYCKSAWHLQKNNLSAVC